MKRIGTALLVAAMIAALLAIPLGVAAATGDHNESQQTTPGEQLGGVVGVQAAAVDGELDDRTFGQQIANADSDEQRADLINERLNQTEQRIADHEARIAGLTERRAAGEISEGRYQAQLARIEAERANTERTIERANDTARGLPEDVLAERGINADRINDLRTNARQLGGPATSEAAREITGDNVTPPIGGDRLGGDRGAGDRPAGDRAGDRPAGDGRLGSDHATTDRDQRSVDRGENQAGGDSDRGSGNSDATDNDQRNDNSGADNSGADNSGERDVDGGNAGSNANQNNR